jgi:hypothetical protein
MASQERHQWRETISTIARRALSGTSRVALKRLDTNGRIDRAGGVAQERLKTDREPTRIADSSSTNGVSFSSARTMKRFTGRRDVRLHSRLFALSSDGRADGLRIRRHNRARLLGTFAHLPVYSSVAKTLCGETPFGISRITR